jgi:hypothetical protein
MEAMAVDAKAVIATARRFVRFMKQAPNVPDMGTVRVAPNYHGKITRF